MEYSEINFEEKLAKFSEHWSPKILAQMNDYHFKLVKFQDSLLYAPHQFSETTKRMTPKMVETAVRAASELSEIVSPMPLSRELAGDKKKDIYLLRPH